MTEIERYADLLDVSLRKGPEGHPIESEEVVYEDFEKIGEGSEGAVYKATRRSPFSDDAEKETVAIKFPRQHADPPFAGRWERERMLYRTLGNSPNLMHFKGVMRHPDFGDGLVMEYMEGEDMGTYTLYHGHSFADDYPLTLKVLGQVCRGLDELHKVGVIHRDIRPDNIYFANDARAAAVSHKFPYTVKLFDYGIAIPSHEMHMERETFQYIDSVAAQPNLFSDASSDSRMIPALPNARRKTPLGRVMGGSEYSAPERNVTNDKATGKKSDLFSIGAIGYEMLTKVHPFGQFNNLSDALRKITFTAPRRWGGRDNTNKDIQQVIMTLLDKDPDRRKECTLRNGPLAGQVVQIGSCSDLLKTFKRILIAHKHPYAEQPPFDTVILEEEGLYFAGAHEDKEDKKEES